LQRRVSFSHCQVQTLEFPVPKRASTPRKISFFRSPEMKEPRSSLRRWPTWLVLFSLFPTGVFCSSRGAGGSSPLQALALWESFPKVLVWFLLLYEILTEEASRKQLPNKTPTPLVCLSKSSKIAPFELPQFHLLQQSTPQDPESFPQSQTNGW